jgi:trehalose 6-phosphate synthase
MLVRMNPSRLYVPANAEYVRRVETAAVEVNEDLAVEAVRVHCDDDVNHSVGCFQRADLLIINSTMDGQNLMAFEASLTNTRDAELVLSENCGAAEVLGSVCRTVNPFDLVEQADAIVAGLTASADERAAAARRRRSTAEPWTVEAWARMQLDGLMADHARGHDADVEVTEADDEALGGRRGGHRHDGPAG